MYFSWWHGTLDCARHHRRPTREIGEREREQNVPADWLSRSRDDCEEKTTLAASVRDSLIDKCQFSDVSDRLRQVDDEDVVFGEKSALVVDASSGEKAFPKSELNACTECRALGE